MTAWVFPTGTSPWMILAAVSDRLLRSRSDEFGQELIKWIYGLGARYLCLVSRSLKVVNLLCRIQLVYRYNVQSIPARRGYFCNKVYSRCS